MKELKHDFVEMVGRMSQLSGGERLAGLVEALSTTEPSIGVRPNRRKGATIAEGRVVEWGSGHERRLDGERPRFTFDPALHQGLYYVQDPSSMAIGRVVDALTADGRPRVYIDACAAPGGKTTAAIDALPDRSVVIANEWDRRRAEILKENVIKWGYPSVIVSRGDTKRFRKLRDLADIIAVDAPCSGEGMMRKDDDAVAQWSPALVAECTALQREIVANMWEALRPGGYLIYSTCTFNTAENEENVKWMIDELGAENLPLPLPEVETVSAAIGDHGVTAARFIPGVAEGEGLFMALLRKPGDDEQSIQPPRKITQPKGLDQLMKWLKDSDMQLSVNGDSVVAVPSTLQPVLSRASKALDIILSGVEVAVVKGRDYIPSQSLALSNALNRGAFANIEVDYPTAIAALRGESVTLDDAPRGIVLLTYGDRPLAFVKNLGNRANNLYPKAWAIKSTHLPETPPTIIGSGQ